MAKNTAKDAKMAAELKKRGVTRTTHVCSVCYRTVGNGKAHISVCKG